MVAPLGNPAVLLRGLEELAGVGTAAVGLAKPCEHAGELGDPVVVVEALHPAGLAPTAAVDDHVRVGVCGDVGQGGVDDDRVRGGRAGEAAADLHRGAPAYASVDLVEHHRGAL